MTLDADISNQNGDSQYPFYSGFLCPLGCIFAGLLFGILKYGGTKIQMPPIEAPSEVINIMIGIIVFSIAMPKIFEIYKKMHLKMSLKFRKKDYKEMEGNNV